MVYRLAKPEAAKSKYCVPRLSSTLRILKEFSRRYEIAVTLLLSCDLLIPSQLDTRGDYSPHSRSFDVCIVWPELQFASSPVVYRLDNRIVPSCLPQSDKTYEVSVTSTSSRPSGLGFLFHRI